MLNLALYKCQIVFRLHDAVKLLLQIIFMLKVKDVVYHKFLQLDKNAETFNDEY